MFFVSYQDSGPLELAFSVLDAATRNVWSPAAKAFVPAGGNATATPPVPPPADQLTPLVRAGGPNLQTVRVGVLVGLPDPPSPGQYLAYVHPAVGGEPVAGPLVIEATAPCRPRNVAVAVTAGV